MDRTSRERYDGARDYNTPGTENVCFHTGMIPHLLHIPPAAIASHVFYSRHMPVGDIPMTRLPKVFNRTYRASGRNKMAAKCNAIVTRFGRKRPSEKVVHSHHETRIEHIY